MNSQTQERSVYDVTVDVILEFLRRGVNTSFTREELYTAIRERGGGMYVAPGMRIKAYFNEMMEMNELTFDPDTNTYTVLKQIYI